MTTRVIFVPEDKPYIRAEWQGRVRAHGVLVSESTNSAVPGWTFTHGNKQITVPKSHRRLLLVKPEAYAGRKNLLELLVKSGALISADMGAIRGAYEELTGAAAGPKRSVPVTRPVKSSARGGRHAAE